MASSKQRIDWMPGGAALRALQVVMQKQPQLTRQEAIDYAMLVAASALTHEPWHPPQVGVTGRYKWSLHSAGALGSDGPR